MICSLPAAARLALLVLALALAAHGALPLDRYAGTVKEFQLANGLKIILIEDHASPVVTACFTARGGYADDPQGMRGLASLVPALLEQGPEQLGSKNLVQERAAIKEMNAAYAQLRALDLKPGSSALYDRMRAEARFKLAIRVAESLGKPQFSARALDLHGAQSFRAVATADHIQWSVRLPSNRIDAFLLLYGEWLRLPFPRFISGNKERRAQEFAQSQASPDAALRRTVLSLAFGPAGYGLMDWEPSEMDRVQYVEVESYLKSRLVATNLVLTLAGDLTLESARALAEKYLAKIPAGSPAALALPKPPELAELRAPPPKEAPGAILVGYRRPPESDPDDPVMDVIEQTLLEGANGRFRNEFLAANPMLARFIPIASLPGARQGGLMAAIVAHHPAKTPNEWSRLIAEFFESAANQPMDAATIAAAQRMLESRLLSVLADPFLAAQHVGRMGGWAKTAALPQAWALVTPQEVQRVAAKYLRPELRVILQPGFVTPPAGTRAPATPPATPPPAGAKPTTPPVAEVPK